MASFTCEKNSHLQSEQYCRDRHSAYKKLIADLAQHLGKEDVKMIAFKCSLSENLRQSSALDVLAHLDRCAKFSPTNIQPLAELLKGSYRNDLVNDYVEGYRLKYGTAKGRPVLLTKNGRYDSFSFIGLGRFTLIERCTPLSSSRAACNMWIG